MGRESWTRSGTPCLAELQPFSAFCSEQKCSPICFFKLFVALSSSGNGEDGSHLREVMIAVGFPTLPLKCRAEGCPTVHLPSTNSVDDAYFPLPSFLCCFQHKSLVNNIFKTVTLLQKLYKHDKYQLPSSQGCLSLFVKTRLDKVTIQNGFF